MTDLLKLFTQRNPDCPPESWRIVSAFLTATLFFVLYVLLEF